MAGSGAFYSGVLKGEVSSVSSKSKHCRAALGLLLGAFLALLPFPWALADRETEDEQPIFYPDPPDRPRLQFLKSFSSALDVSAKSKGFRDFVFGGEENENDLVEKPYGVAMHEGALYVVDTRGNGWGVFDMANRRSRLVRPGGSGSLIKPINITIDEDGTRYVTDTQREQVVVYDANDKFLRALGEKGEFRPVDVVIDGERLYLTDIMHHRICVLDKQTGEILLTMGETGSKAGQLFQPTNLTLAPDGSLYVVDTGNFRIQQFSPDGEFIRAFGRIGTGAGTFSRPKGIALDHGGRFYVVDAAFENVQILDQTGAALMFFGAPGGERDSINLPTVVKIDYDNVEYFQEFVADGFDVEYLVIVASQFGLNKVVVFGFGSARE